MKKVYEAPTASCAICASPLRQEIEKRDGISRADETIQWAKKKGINISRFSLAKHRANHLKTTDVTPPDKPKQKPDDPSPGAGVTASRDTQPRITSLPNAETEAISVAALGPPKAIEKTSSDNERHTPVSDELFLNTIRDRVYERLVKGELKLDIGDAFKAIDIKHKIAETSQNEKLLLEILSEIRREELKRNEQ